MAHGNFRLTQRSVSEPALEYDIEDYMNEIDLLKSLIAEESDVEKRSRRQRYGGNGGFSNRIFY